MVDDAGAARDLIAKGRYEEVEPLLRATLAEDERHLGPNCLEVATHANHLAEVLAATGRLEEAAALLRRTLAIKRQTLGSDHPGVATALHNLAVLYESMGHDDAARAMWAEAEIVLADAGND